MTRRTRTVTIGIVLLVALAAFAVPTLRRHVQAVLVLLSAVGAEDPTGITDLVRHSVGDATLRVDVGARKLRARLFTPHGVDAPPGVIVLHGVHPRGIDEPRLIAFARGLSATGLSVLTPELPELIDHRVEPRTLDDIAGCARAYARILSRASVGAYGISFAGGLLLMAAARDGSHFAYVVAVGAHHDLSRLAQYYAGRTVRGPDGSSAHVPAHPYGARVIIRAHVGELFAESDRELAHRVLGLWLSEQYARARKQAKGLSAEGAALMAVILDDRQHATMGDRMMEGVARNAERLASVSPKGNLAALRVPTYLVHGRDDPVIPSIATQWLAREVPSQSLRGALITPVLSHMDLSTRPSLGEHARVIRLVARMLDEQ